VNDKLEWPMKQTKVE